jgi:hypothetical protein
VYLYLLSAYSRLAYRRALGSIAPLIRAASIPSRSRQPCRMSCGSLDPRARLHLPPGDSCTRHQSRLKRQSLSRPGAPTQEQNRARCGTHLRWECRAEEGESDGARALRALVLVCVFIWHHARVQGVRGHRHRSLPGWLARDYHRLIFSTSCVGQMVLSQRRMCTPLGRQHLAASKVCKWRWNATACSTRHKRCTHSLTQNLLADAIVSTRAAAAPL